jgi:hypothetical protein
LTRWIEIFGCDLRALATFRLALGLALFLHAAVYGTLAGSVFGWGAALVALAVCLGYRTRLSATLSWILLAAPPLIAADVPPEHIRLLIALSLFGAFLPLGARYSLDSAVDPERHRGERIVTGATAILRLQAVWFFASTGLAYSMGAAAAQPTWPVGGAAAGTAVVALLGLLPSRLFDWLERYAAAFHRNRLRIYYDRDCGFCRKICLIFRTFMLLGDTSVQPAQEHRDACEIMHTRNTWVVYDFDGTAYVRWHAVLLLLRRSAAFRPLGLALTAVRMGEWADPIYAAIAASRGRWSRVTALLVPYRHVEVRAARAETAVLVAWLLLALLYSLNVIFVPEEPGRPSLARVLAGVLALDQRWGGLASVSPR